MAKKATHQGHCQCCGRIQKLPGGLLSKHGYTVAWGFFNGVCSGAHHQPLELDRKILDQTVVALRDHAEYALNNDPAKVVCSVARDTRYVGRRRVCSGGEVAFNDFDAFRKSAFEHKDNWQMQGWRKGFDYSTLQTADAAEMVKEYGTPEEQEERTVAEKYAEARRDAIHRAHSNARQAQFHADALVKMADEIHGQPLKEIKA